MISATQDKNSNLLPDGISASPITTGFALFRSENRVSFVRSLDRKVDAPEGFTAHYITYRETEKSKQAGKIQSPKMVFLPNVVLPPYEKVELLEEDGKVTSLESGYALPDVARKVLVGAIEDAMSDLVRAAVDEERSVISWDDVSIDKALDFLTATRTAFRLTKEGVEAWAKAKLLHACYSRADELSAEKGFEEKSKEWSDQRNAVLARYVAETSKLSAAVPNLDQKTATAVQVMLKRAEVQDDDIGKMLLRKLDAMLNPKFIADGL